MGNGPLPDDADFIAASAVAALAIAVTAAQRVKGDPVLADWVSEIGELPSWRDDADAWARGLRTIQAKYALPSDEELASRSIEQSLFNRVRSSARDAMSSRDPRARHFYLSMASIAAGSLLGVAYGRETPAAIEAAFTAAHSKSGRQGGITSNAPRNALKDAAMVYLSDSFPNVPMHESGAAKGKPDLPELAKALGLFPATSHLPEKTRKQWAQAWAIKKLTIRK